MKTIKLISAVILSTAMTAASAQCEKKIDDMTQKVSITSKAEAISGIGTGSTSGKLPLRVYASYEDSTTTLYMRMAVAREQTVPPGTIVFLEMGTDSLELKTTEKASADRGESGVFGPREDKDNRPWYAIMKFVLTSDQLAKLKTNKITGISIDKRDYDVGGAHQSVIINMLKCLDAKK